MLKYEWLILDRNKVSRVYFYSSVGASLVGGMQVFLIEQAGFHMPVEIVLAAFFALGGPLYIYSIYSFSWESCFARLSLQDSGYFSEMVKTKLLVNMLYPTLAFMVSASIFYFILGQTDFNVLFVSWIYAAVPGNLMTLWLCSHWLRKVDWYEDRFEIIKQPPGHILIVLANILLYLLIHYLSGLSRYGPAGLLIVGLIAWLLIKPIMVEASVRNLKNASYAIPTQPLHQGQ